MAYNLEVVENVLVLRAKGFSIKELSRKFNISVDTVSRWCSKVSLNSKAQKILKNKKRLGQLKGLDILNQRNVKKLEKVKNNAVKTIDKASFQLSDQKILCSMLYWAEGAKSRHDLLTFINSDPKMIKLFLKFLRNCFPLDESKFRILLHLHQYHNEAEIKNFWSKVTGVPITQFNKSFRKENTKNRTRKNYMGTISLRYYNSEVAHELQSIYNTVADKFK